MTATTEAAPVLPRWDLDSIFPGPASPELRAAFDAIARDTAELMALIDRHGIGTRDPLPTDPALVAAFDQVVNSYNGLLEDAMPVAGYLFCLTAADVRDQAATGAASEWRLLKPGLATLASRFTAWVGGLDLDALAGRSDIARDHAPALRRIQTASAHLMEPGQEELAAALNPSAGGAWMALRDAVCGAATARIELDGDERELPLSEISNLGYHADRDVRRRAYETLQAAYRALGVPLAAAINGAKGQQLTLSLRRGWDDPLDRALFANAIDREVLGAMNAAIEEALPDFHRMLRAKARFLGLPRLAGYDVQAPVGEPREWPFETARAFIVEQFTAFHPRLGAVAERAFAERWIDAETRPGKDDGAFSMPVGGDQSRVFLNYLPVYDWMSALAHELGHSYHAAAVPQAGRTPIQAAPEDVPAPLLFPATLSETASTLCEALVQRAARGVATSAQEAALLDGWLQAFSLTVFGTYSYFLFERDFFAARRQRELAPAQLDAMMAAARWAVSGDAVDPETVWTISWVAPHYVMDTDWYYNFPYAFGMLFALGLLTARDTQPEGFADRFDMLLADSGMREAQELAAPFGIDLRDPGFWRTSLDAFRADVDRFEALAHDVESRQSKVDTG